MDSAKFADAVAHFRRGDFSGAQRLCHQLLRRESNNVQVLHLLGAAHMSAGALPQAISVLKRGLIYAPGDAALAGSLGLAHLAAQDFAAAEAQFRTLLDRGQPEAYLNLGNALAAQHREQEAADVLAAMLAKWPHHRDAHYNRGVLLQRLRRFDEAAAAYADVLRIDPAHVDSENNRGIVLESLGRSDEAEACYRRVLELSPNHVHALNNLGKVLRQSGELEVSARSCLRALEIQPDFADAHLNLGSVRAAQGDFDAALRHYRQALECAPDDADAHTSLGMLCLGLGQFETGWRHYQWRPQRRQAEGAGIAFDDALPADITNKRILLVGEQGLGDELFFLRYAAALKARGARLGAFCDSKIAQPLQRTQLFEAIHVHGTALPESDLRLMIGDLPWIMGNSEAVASHWQNLPSPLSLTPLMPRAEAMRTRLAALGPLPYIGLTWRAGTPPQDQHGRVDRALFKQVPVSALRVALAEARGTLIALQRLPQAGEIDQVSAELGRPVHDLSAVNEDIEDMLALLSLLRHYVGVSNTNMHLLAGLGGSAQVLVPHPPEWRWMTAGAASPWFPGFRVYRQAADGDWSQACATLGLDLAQASGG